MFKTAIVLTMILISFNSFGYKTKATGTQTSMKSSEVKSKMNALEIIDGEPKGRKYKTLGPVMGACDWSTSMECAMKQMKKQAAKLDADAIIKVEVGMKQQTSAGGGLFTGFYGASTEHALVKGWAVQWVE